METVFKKRAVYALLVLLVICHLGLNFIWLKQDTTLFINDPHHHSLFSFAVFDELSRHSLPGLERTLDRITMHHRWHGVLVAYVTAPFFFIFGKTQDAAAAAQSLVFFPLLLFSVFGIGKLVRDAKTGLLAACLVSLYPLIFNHLRLYLLDLPLTALVSWSVYLFLRSDYLTKRTHTFLFSLSVVLGMLCKLNFIIFITGPLIVGGCRVLASLRGKEKKRWLLRLVFVCGIVAVACVPFLRLKRWEVAARLTEFCWLNPENHQSFVSLGAFAHAWFVTIAKYYFWLIPEFINTIVSFVLFLALCLAAYPFLKNPLRHRAVLMAWGAVPLLVISIFFVHLTINRYLMPLVPVVALVTAAGLLSIKSRLLRRGSIGVFLLLGAFQCVMLSFNPLGRFHPMLDIKESAILVDSRLTNGRIRDILAWNGGISLGYRNGESDVTFPQKPFFAAELLLQEINAHRDDRETVMYISFIDVPAAVYEPVEFLAYKNNDPVALTVASANAEASQRDSLEPFYFVTAADYVVVGAGGCRQEGTNAPADRDAQAGSILLERLGSFRLLKIYSLPDGKKLYLYKHKKKYLRLTAGALRCYFRDGLVKLYSGTQALTRSYGMTNRFEHGKKEYSSNAGLWRVLQAGERLITAVVTWPGSGITQKWTFEISSKNTLLLLIESDFPRQEEIAHFRFLLSLSPAYHYWQSGSVRQRFISRRVRMPVYLPLSLPLAPLLFSGNSIPALSIIAQEAFRGAWIIDQKDGPVLLLGPRRQDKGATSYMLEISSPR